MCVFHNQDTGNELAAWALAVGLFLGYGRHGEWDLFLERRRVIVLDEIPVHRSAGRVRMDLHEKLADHFAAQSLAYGRDLAGRFRYAAFAGQSRF